jgi:hypothetical protein
MSTLLEYVWRVHDKATTSVRCFETNVRVTENNEYRRVLNDNYNNKETARKEEKRGK